MLKTGLRKSSCWAAKFLALLVNSLIMFFVESIAYWPKCCLAELNNFQIAFLVEDKTFQISILHNFIFNTAHFSINAAH